MRNGSTEKLSSSDRPTVLVVDDEPGVLVTTSALLSDDYDVLTSKSVDDALAIIERRTIDVVCTDFNMPGRTGVELLDLIAKRPRPIPGLLVTGFQDIVISGRRSQGHSYLVLYKPYPPLKLLEMVKSALQFGRLRDMLARPPSRNR